MRLKMVKFYETLKSKIEIWNNKQKSDVNSKKFVEAGYGIYDKFGNSPKVYLVGTYPYNQKDLEKLFDSKDKVIINSNEIFLPRKLQEETFNAEDATYIDSQNLDSAIRKTYSHITEWLGRINDIKNRGAKCGSIPLEKELKVLTEDGIPRLDKILEEYYKKKAHFLFQEIKESKDSELYQVLNVTDILAGFLTKELKDNGVNYVTLLPLYININNKKLFAKLWGRKDVSAYDLYSLMIWNANEAYEIAKESFKMISKQAEKLKREIQKEKELELKVLNNFDYTKVNVH